VNESLVDWLLNRASEENALSERAQLVVLGALMGDNALDDMLAGDIEAAPAAAINAEMAPSRAFLKSIAVEGFRGVGPRAVLPLNPAPGLVVIAGRNGSGKSSFAEALEIALTGDSYRWRKKSRQWVNQWRNLHHATTAVTVEIVEEGAGVTKIGAEWASGAELDARGTWVQRAGSQREAGLRCLGWAAPLETYRPLLSYDELGNILEDSPSALHDALERILGLEQLNDAIRRLDQRVKFLSENRRRASTIRLTVRRALEGLTDERAVAALSYFKRSAPNINQVTKLIAGAEAEPTGILAQLTRIANLTLPSAAAAQAAAEGLRAAAENHRQRAEATLAAEDSRAALLGQAIEHYDKYGEEDCPVCGVGTLTESWALRVRQGLADQKIALSALREARQRLAATREAAEALTAPVPTVLSAIDLPAGDAAASAWQAWANTPGDDALMAAHLETKLGPVRTALEALQAKAAAEYERRNDEWLRVVPSIVEWIQAADEAAANATTLEPVEAAFSWLKANAAMLRNERLEPLAAHSRQIWAQLRQESNVDLGRITLEGAATRRRVDLSAQVDGVDTGALSVMSQGELHALALALFIPRATATESPFRFVVLDDPIQAMDPAKVDGFVNVLDDLAKTHQVVVLSHDDRLLETIRRLSVNARILEVTRSVNSVLTIRSGLDPATRYLQDAYALAKDDGLGDKPKADVVPTLLRMAVEAKCRDVYYARELSAGATRDAVESAWQSNVKTRNRVALALYGADHPLDSWLGGKGHRKRGLGIVTSAAHDGLNGPVLNAIEDVQRLVADLDGVR
jgi:recombinational DNA repair ATPase RecF